jgi:hypothetical protein
MAAEHLNPIARRPRFAPYRTHTGRWRAVAASWAWTALALLVALPVQASAPPPPATTPSVSKPARAVGKSAPTHVWHDGSVTRTLTVEPTLEADFSARVGKDAGVLRPAGSAVGKSALDQVSPVLRDESGQLRALPGGVLVVLPAPMDERAGRALIVESGGVPARALSPTLWVVEAPVGLPALEVANRLHASGRFASVQPNWWVARTLK